MLTSFNIQLQHSSISLRGASGHIFIRFPVNGGQYLMKLVDQTQSLKFTHTTASGVFVDTVVGEVLALKAVLRKHSNVNTESTVRLNANTALRRERAVFIVRWIDVFNTWCALIRKPTTSRSNSQTQPLFGVQSSLGTRLRHKGANQRNFLPPISDWYSVNVVHNWLMSGDKCQGGSSQARHELKPQCFRGFLTLR